MMEMQQQITKRISAPIYSQSGMHLASQPKTLELSNEIRNQSIRQNSWQGAYQRLTPTFEFRIRTPIGPLSTTLANSIGNTRWQGGL